VLAEFGLFLAIGAVVGFFAGLLGIGGGIIIVSTLALVFVARGLPAAYVMHLAIGTSLAAIAAGAFASFRTHHRHGAVDWAVVKAMTPGLLVGVAGGVLMARWMPTAWLKGLFLALMTCITAQMAFNLRPKAMRELPGRGGLFGVGTFIGAVSSFFGGGAAAIGVPYLSWCSMDTHRAIGTCAAMGFTLAIAGSVGYAVAGWGVPGMPRPSVGFVYLPAFVGISATSMLVAPWGARLAHRLKGATLRRIFALFLLAMGLKLAVSV
jgi:uncharacterized protein